MQITRKDLVLGCQVKIKVEAEFILKREGLWHHSLKSSLGKIVNVIFLDDYGFKSLPLKCSLDTPKSEIGMIKTIQKVILWTYDCIECIVNVPTKSDNITLGELIDVIPDKQEALNVIRTLRVSNGEIPLSNLLFRIEDLEKNLPSRLIRYLHELSFNSNSKNFLDGKIEEHEEEIKKLKQQKRLFKC